MALNQFQMLKAQKSNIKETYLIDYTTTTPPCNCYSFVIMKYKLYAVSDNPQLMPFNKLLQISRSFDLQALNRNNNNTKACYRIEKIKKRKPTTTTTNECTFQFSYNRCIE